MCGASGVMLRLLVQQSFGGCANPSDQVWGSVQVPVRAVQLRVAHVGRERQHARINTIPGGRARFVHTDSELMPFMPTSA
jgi:hypothetical protein